MDSVCTTYSRAASLHPQHNIQEANIGRQERVRTFSPAPWLSGRSLGIGSLYAHSAGTQTETRTPPHTHDTTSYTPPHAHVCHIRTHTRIHVHIQAHPTQLHNHVHDTTHNVMPKLLTATRLLPNGARWGPILPGGANRVQERPGGGKCTPVNHRRRAATAGCILLMPLVVAVLVSPAAARDDGLRKPPMGYACTCRDFQPPFPCVAQSLPKLRPCFPLSTRLLIPHSSSPFCT